MKRGIKITERITNSNSEAFKILVTTPFMVGFFGAVCCSAGFGSQAKRGRTKDTGDPGSRELGDCTNPRRPMGTGVSLPCPELPSPPPAQPLRCIMPTDSLLYLHSCGCRTPLAANIISCGTAFTMRRQSAMIAAVFQTLPLTQNPPSDASW